MIAQRGHDVDRLSFTRLEAGSSLQELQNLQGLRSTLPNEVERDWTEPASEARPFRVSISNAEAKIEREKISPKATRVVQPMNPVMNSPLRENSKPLVATRSNRRGPSKDAVPITSIRRHSDFVTGARPSADENKFAEQIVVRECDLKRCGSDLARLRACGIIAEKHVPPMHVRPITPPAEEEELTFKSAYDLNCRKVAAIRDPWKDLENPEKTRKPNDMDYVINEVWVPSTAGTSRPMLDTDQGRKISKQKTVRATSADHTGVVVPTFIGRYRDVTAEREFRHNRRKRHSITEPSFSLQFENASVGAQHPQPVQNRIQPTSVETINEQDAPSVGSYIVRTSTKEQAAHLRKISPVDLWRKDGPDGVWVALDAKSGALVPYSSSAAERLDEASRAGRTNVPLAGLGPSYENIIVNFDTQLKGKERDFEGHVREICRAAILPDSDRITVKVVWDAVVLRYRVAMDDDAAQAQERYLPLREIPYFRPATPKLPVVKDRRISFVNAIAEW